MDKISVSLGGTASATTCAIDSTNTQDWFKVTTGGGWEIDYRNDTKRTRFRS